MPSETDLYAPVSGTIVEANIILEDQPELVNASPYGQGWMVAIEAAPRLVGQAPTVQPKILLQQDSQMQGYQRLEIFVSLYR